MKSRPVRLHEPELRCGVDPAERAGAEWKHEVLPVVHEPHGFVEPEDVFGKWNLRDSHRLGARRLHDVPRSAITGKRHLATCRVVIVAKLIALPTRVGCARRTVALTGNRGRTLEPGAKIDEPATMMTTTTVQLTDEEWKVLLAMKEELQPDEIVADPWVGRAEIAGVFNPF